MLRALHCDRSTISLAEGIRKETRTLPRDRVEIKLALYRSGPEAVRGALAFSGDPAKALGMLEAVLASGECWSERMLCLGGRDIPAEGAACGRILRRLTEHCIRHPEDNRRDRLLALAGEWL